MPWHESGGVLFVSARHTSQWNARVRTDRDHGDCGCWKAWLTTSATVRIGL
jgi:hypothetical protein